MKNIIMSIYYCYNIGGFKYVFSKIKDKLTGKKSASVVLYKMISEAKPQQYRKFIESIYREITRSDINLDNPRTFNEKIQWLKLYDSTELKTRLTDKYLVRDWIADKIGESYLIPLLGVWHSQNEVDIDKLPNKFVLKATHGSGWNIIVKNKKNQDWGGVKRSFDCWMDLNFAYMGLELHYSPIIPRIIAEEYIESKSGNLLDYKIHCFNGKPQYIQVIGNRDAHTHCAKEAFYDRAWNMQSFTYTYPKYEAPQKKPEQLEKMLYIAEILSKDFIYVRVDLYELDNGELKFGEMTFTPTAGFNKWSPCETDLKLGQLMHLPQKNIERNG